jgi:hypothetical protein
MNIQLGSLTVKEKLRSMVLDTRILKGISKPQEAYKEKDGETYICELS